MDRNYGHAKPQEEQILVRSWIPAEGIERQVLQAEVQFYLGSRATSRPREHEVGKYDRFLDMIANIKIGETRL